MRSFGLNGRAFAVATAAAFAAGCGGGHSGAGIPPTSVQSGYRASSATSGEQVLYSFSGGSDGGNAATAIALDNGGNLYGTTVVGGAYACGTVFKLTPKASPPWNESVLHSFTCYSDGKNPHGGVSFDPDGNLDGTTVAGGSGGYCTGDGCGVTYQLTPATENVLHAFTGANDGFGPGGAVVFDRKGNVYGTTPDGGSNYVGVVYEIQHSGAKWHYRVIHPFTGGDDGSVGSLGALLIDKSGSLYGVAEEGGAHGAGTVFELSRKGKRWKFTTLYAFKGTPDAGSPYGGLVADKSGKLYGTTYYGGANGLGAVYELVPGRHGKYKERVLYSFAGGSDGSSSTTTLAFGSSNDLYGTTSAGGGTCDCGTIFKVNAKTGQEAVLHSFGMGKDGAYPYYGLTPDGKGNFFGSTVAGGNFGQGAVFEFTP